MKENEAFVYLWQDAREKPYRYYLGYHKGSPDDSYTHSSTVFESFTKDSFPDGVSRRILATGTSEEMMELENKLLNNRKESKWDRYYNICVSFPPYMWDDPEFRQMKSENSSETVKKLWDDPEFRQMMSENSSETVKKLWDDPEFRQMMSEQRFELNKKQWQEPEYRQMMSENSSERAKKLWEDPEYRQMHSEMRKKQWEDPEYRQMMSENSSERAKSNVCGFVTNKQNIAQWHNEKCKYKDT